MKRSVTILTFGFVMLLWFGAGRGQELTYLGVEQCQGCHSGAPGGDQFSFWEMTAHSEAYDSVSTFVQQTASCLECHTTGWILETANGGADDFVTIDPNASTFNVTIDDETEFKKKANVQCESCHGPSSGHAANIFVTGETPPSDASAAENCGSCHEGEHHPNLSEWQQSKHASSLTSDFVPDFLLTDTDCAGCHTLQGFIQFVGTTAEDSTNNIPEGIEAPGAEAAYPVNCATCHDPHDPLNPGQLRLPPAQLCAKCHNPEDAQPPDNPHHSTASMFDGAGAFEFQGVEYRKNSAHQQLPALTEEKCVTCHVFMTPFDGGDPNDPSDDVPAFVGHTFEPRLVACTQAGCHVGGLVETEGEEFNHRGRQTFTKTLLDSLRGILDDIEADIRPRVTAQDSFDYEIGLFNWRFASNEGSRGVHNPNYAEDVLEHTIAFLDTALVVTSVEANPDPLAGVPKSFELHQNFPNPFNPTTKIRFDVPTISHVRLVIYNALGQEIETLVDERLTPNTYDADFDASHLSSGLYFYKLVTNGFSKTKKMLLLK
ncbi:T9SS type A sorting domain-containing protein [bacterium]|nr:T9SS type A sorting domain-containing protein [bacterium]